MWKYFIYGVEHFLAFYLPQAVAFGGAIIVVAFIVMLIFRELDPFFERNSHDQEMDKLRLKQQHEFNMEGMKLQRAALDAENERLRSGK